MFSLTLLRGSFQINFLGNAHAVRPTENAQYVFSTISRKRYVLNSMERAVQICNALAKDPHNQFLLPYNQSGMCLRVSKRYVTRNREAASTHNLRAPRVFHRRGFQT